MIDFTLNDIDQMYNNGKNMADYFSNKYNNETDVKMKTREYNMGIYIENMIKAKQNMAIITKYFSNPANLNIYFNYDSGKYKAVETRQKIDNKIKLCCKIISESNKLVNESYIEITNLKDINSIRKYRSYLLKEKSNNVISIKKYKNILLNMDKYIRFKEKDDVLKNIYIFNVIKNFIKYLNEYNVQITELINLSK